MKDKLLFVHIPKTAGTSVTQSFRKSSYSTKFAVSPFPNVKHITLTEYADLNNLENFFKFTVVRNPYTRTYSYYRQYQRRNGYKKSLEHFLHFINTKRPLIEERANNRLFTFSSRNRSFVNSLHEIDYATIGEMKEYYKKISVNRTLRGADGDKFITDTTPFVFSTQSYYIKNESNQISIDKIYRIENMKELESDFNIIVNNINVNNGNYTKDDYYRDFNPTTIDMVKQLYAEDFVNFGYSTDFS